MIYLMQNSLLLFLPPLSKSKALPIDFKLQIFSNYGSRSIAFKDSQVSIFARPFIYVINYRSK